MSGVCHLWLVPDWRRVGFRTVRLLPPSIDILRRPIPCGAMAQLVEPGTVTETTTALDAGRRPVGGARRALETLSHNPMFWVGGILAGAIVLAAILAPLL